MLPFTRWSVRKPGPKRLAAKKISAVSRSVVSLSSFSRNAVSFGAVSLGTVSLGAVSLGAVGVIAAGALSAGTASASATTGARGSAHGGQAGFTSRAILSGASLRHTFVAGGKHHSAPLTLPDDITTLGPVLFTAFQNGVGPQGQPSTTGNQDSTVVEFTPRGHVLRQWDIRGKCDGLTADPDTHQVIATVNEDAHSSVYTIDPWAAPAAQVRHYHYSEPLPSKGGTDAISIFHGLVLVSASAPGTTGAAAPRPSYPAVYQVTFEPAELIARIQPVFYDESKATVANAGQRGSVKLALTDPDSNEVVPWDAPRFAGDFMLTSQGDKEQIFLGQARLGAPGPVGPGAEQLGGRHRVGHQHARRAVRDQHRCGHRGHGDRALHAGHGVRRGHPV